MKVWGGIKLEGQFYVGDKYGKSWEREELEKKNRKVVYGGGKVHDLENWVGVDGVGWGIGIER